MNTKEAGEHLQISDKTIAKYCKELTDSGKHCFQKTGRSWDIQPEELDILKAYHKDDRKTNQASNKPNSGSMEDPTVRAIVDMLESLGVKVDLKEK